MERYLATNWKNAIYYDENNHVIQEWDGDVVQIYSFVIRKDRIYLDGKIESIFVPLTERIDLLYSNRKHKLQIEKKENVITFQFESKMESASNQTIEFYVTCCGAVQRAKIIFTNKKRELRRKNHFYANKDWIVRLKRKEMEIISNDSLKGKIKAIVAGIIPS